MDIKKILFCLFVVILLLISLYSQLPDKRLHLYVCNVGQGDGILITKGSSQILIDAGPDNSVESCLGNHMPFWDRTIEVAIMTHVDSDHSFGFIQLLKRYTVLNFFQSPIEGNSEEYNKIREEFREFSIHRIIAHTGQKISMNGIEIDILFPLESAVSSGETNDYCVVSRVTYGLFSAMFACDISPRSEDVLLSQSLVTSSYLLKVPHHGSVNGLTENFLEKVRPKVAVISVAKKNRYKLPSQEILELLKKHSVKIFRTDMNGEIEISTDGKTVWTK